MYANARTSVMELKELGNSIKDVVWETISEAINKCLLQGKVTPPPPTDHANALSNLSDASNSQKKQIEELTKAVL